LPDITTVIEKILAWVKKRIALQAGIDWRFTTEDARIKLKQIYPVVYVQDSA
jgi:hypothetical protein